MHNFFSSQNCSVGHAEAVSLGSRLSQCQPHMMEEYITKLSHERNNETVGFDK